MDDSAPRPGRTCPLSYRYSPAVFDRPPDFVADTIYVIGGLYGNQFALRAVLELAAAEPVKPMLVFNGDFNWFDIDPGLFREVNDIVMSNRALRGNVETELATDDDQGCGCGYPDDVSDAEVARSNAILRTLRDTARQHANIRRQLAALPMHAVAQVGATRIGIVHGDAESLAGWGFAQDQLDRPDRHAALERIFAMAKVDLFASSHTCLPALRQFPFGMVINNGAAGMPNFAGDRAGLITRIGAAPSPHRPVYGCATGAVHVDALRVEYDYDAWLATFEKQWPAGSAGHLSYFHRITRGPAFSPDRAFSPA